MFAYRAYDFTIDIVVFIFAYAERASLKMEQAFGASTTHNTSRVVRPTCAFRFAFLIHAPVHSFPPFSSSRKGEKGGKIILFLSLLSFTCFHFCSNIAITFLCIYRVCVLVFEDILRILHTFLFAFSVDLIVAYVVNIFMFAFSVCVLL